MKVIYGNFSFELCFVLWLLSETDAEVILSAPPEWREAGGRTKELTGLLLLEIIEARLDWDLLTIKG